MIRWFWKHFEEVTGAVLVVVLCLAATLQVLSRYLLGTPFSWTEEIATLGFAWLVFIGASLALKQNAHFAITTLVESLPPRLNLVARRLALVCVILAGLLLVIYGVRLALHSAHVRTPILGLSRAWLYLAAPAGGLLLMLRAAEQLLASRRRPPTAEEPTGKEVGS